MIRGVREAVRFLGRVDALVSIHREDFEIAERERSIKAAFPPVKIYFDGLREPELLFVRMKANGAVVDNFQLLLEAGGGNRFYELRYEPENLVRGGVDPGASF